MPDISEKSFEDAIEAALLAGGPDARGEIREPLSTYGDMVAGGYRRRSSRDYDADLCLIGRDALDFLQITQPHEWAKYKKVRGKEAPERFLGRLAGEVRKRGTLDVLRRGVADAGCRFNLAYFRPASGLNQDLQRLYEGNLFCVVRQLRYNEAGDALDLALFLNGLPLFTAELKNPFTGQTVDDAKYQYVHDRDPRDPLLAFRRCLAHFAVDVDKVYVTTRLAGEKTVFLPFNQGYKDGAGNPPASVLTGGYATAYLWNHVWARDSVLDLVQHFVHELPDDAGGNGRNGKKRLIFPRYHQLDAVRRLVAHARDHGTGQRYLVQHSAGSGKSNSIAWLAHRLSILLGVVENIDQTSRQLREALESGKTIIVTTLQKFPVIVGDLRDLAGQRFAVIVDEAHSSQTGDSARSLKRVLAVANLEADRLESDDKFLRHLTDVVCEALGKVAATCLDPRIQTVDGKAVCVVACRRSALPVYLKWKGTEKSPEGDFYVRTGPGSRTLEGDEIAAYVASHFGAPARGLTLSE